MRKAVFPGSFDPFTLGHLDILKRSLSLFDEITVGVGGNNEKKTMFSERQRIKFIKKCFENEPKIKVESYEGLTIDFCKKNSPYQFRCSDFIKEDLNEKFDLVFSHAVIDHVYDIDAFLKRIVNTTKKFAFVNSYRGYFPDLKEHKMKWRDDQACYFNDISIMRIKQVLLDCHLTEEEFIIRPQDNGYGILQTTIEITKK